MLFQQPFHPHFAKMGSGSQGAIPLTKSSHPLTTTLSCKLTHHSELSHSDNGSFIVSRQAQVLHCPTHALLLHLVAAVAVTVTMMQEHRVQLSCHSDCRNRWIAWLHLHTHFCTCTEQDLQLDLCASLCFQGARTGCRTEVHDTSCQWVPTSTHCVCLHESSCTQGRKHEFSTSREKADCTPLTHSCHDAATAKPQCGRCKPDCKKVLNTFGSEITFCEQMIKNFDLATQVTVQEI